MCQPMPQGKDETPTTNTAPPGDPLTYMKLALDQAQESPPKPTNFRVGALLVDEDANTVLARSYTLELPGNTHAEQNCFAKIAQSHDIPWEQIGEFLPANTVLYTTMEPCAKRLSGNLPCVDRILKLKRKDGRLAIRKIYIGIKEPEKFVGENEGRQKLADAGIECIAVPGLEEDITRVATAGHIK